MAKCQPKEEGFIEETVLQCSEGDLIQLERLDFGRIEILSESKVKINLNGPLLPIK